MTTPRILIIYTGGTIGMGKDAITGTLEPLDFNHLVSSMPEFQLIGRHQRQKVRPTHRLQRHGPDEMG